MCKLNCIRGYRRYTNFNHNRFVVLVKEWHDQRLMIDFYWNEKFLGYCTTETSWSDLFDSVSSDALVLKLMQANDKLNEYVSVFKGMDLSEENLKLETEQFYMLVTILNQNSTSLRICLNADNAVLQRVKLNSINYDDVYEECQSYMNGLENVIRDLMKA